MGYAWSGVCYNGTAEALNAFRLSMTSGNSVGITAFTAAPTISGTGLVTWSISHRPLTGTAATTRTGTTQLDTCTTPLMDQIPVQSLLVPVVLFFAAFSGFKTGYRA